MANWKYNLNIKAEWVQAELNKITIQQLASVAAKRLSLIDFKDEDVNFDRDDLVDEFEGLSEDLTATRDDFDNVWDRLYDFADANRLWIATF